MKPLKFDECVGWPHNNYAAHGAVFCESFEHETSRVHGVMQALAEHLAVKGIWIRRVNYLCSGDLPGGDKDLDRFAKTIIGVHRAVELLRQRPGVSFQRVLGIRIGAMFALMPVTGEGENATPRGNVIAASLLVPSYQIKTTDLCNPAGEARRLVCPSTGCHSDCAPADRLPGFGAEEINEDSITLGPDRQVGTLSARIWNAPAPSRSHRPSFRINRRIQTASARVSDTGRTALAWACRQQRERIDEARPLRGSKERSHG